MKPISEEDQVRSADIDALTAKLVQGDEGAYRQFHETYFHRLFAYLLVVTGGREEEAKDALQATLLRVVRHVRVFQSEEALWSWLTVLARSCAIDNHRKQTRYLSFLGWFFEGKEVQLPAPEPNSEADLVAILERNLSMIEPADRDLIERKYYEKQSVRAIAAGLGATEKAIEMRLARVRQKLRNLALAELHDRSRSERQDETAESQRASAARPSV